MGKVIEFFGLLIMFAGGGAMGGDTPLLAMILAFAGLGIFLGGCYLDELKEGAD